MKINILCLYYDIMNLYGDANNYKVFTYHLDEIGIKYEIDKLSIYDEIDFDKYDVCFIGCGSEENRSLCLSHLIKFKKDVKKNIDNNKFFLVTGNSLAMFGNKVYDEKGLSIFDFDVTLASDRISEEVILDNTFGNPIYGFLNHSDNMSSFDKPLFSDEGVHVNNFYGSYVLGPILARNPDFLRHFVKEVILFKDKDFKFNDIDTSLNDKAYSSYIEFKKTKKFNSKNS